MFRNKFMTCLLVLCFVWAFAGPSVTSAAEKKVEMESSIFGGTLYQLSFAFSKIVNKYSKILEINPVESAGTGAGIMKVYGDPKGTITAGTAITIIAAKHGDKPFNKPYPDMRAIGNFVRNAQVLITLRDDIKSVSDLAGKKVGLGPLPTVLGGSMRYVIENGFGLKGKVKIFYMRWPQLRDSLMDGTIDAMVLGLSMGPNGKWFPVPVYQEITASGKIPRYLSYTKEALQKAERAADSHFPPVLVKKDSVGPGQPQQDILGFTDDLGIWAHKDFNPAFAYEMSRILHDHWKEMRSITGMARATFPDILFDFAVPDDMVHPGTLKYLKEIGLR